MLWLCSVENVTFLMLISYSCFKLFTLDLSLKMVGTYSMHGKLLFSFACIFHGSSGGVFPCQEDRPGDMFVCTFFGYTIPYGLTSDTDRTSDRNHNIDLRPWHLYLTCMPHIYYWSSWRWNSGECLNIHRSHAVDLSLNGSMYKCQLVVAEEQQLTVMLLLYLLLLLAYAALTVHS